ncbi:hypothetical protein BDA99DRAFT_438441 [Phascolomyces articulosus]|uniref:RING-type E3 ubiquitin transferase n=1 Tax=Phascolomyces articulosus TaxID=60185 RepID=A0AAD5KDH9_9FUNG|nr:hypothetical protein BDA99DRAFT_438441 [Phascolomyces articulosus]
MNAEKKDNNNSSQKDGNKQKNNTRSNKQQYHRRKPQQQQDDGQSSGTSSAATKKTNNNNNRRKRPENKSNDNKELKSVEEPSKEEKEKKESSDNEGSDNDDASSEASGDLCFICTEPIVTYAVGNCDHRTCHLCALRLRALYKTKNCALCKSEQATVILTKDPEKPFASYADKDAPFVDKKLGLRFEDKQIQQDTKLLLQYNCPDPDCDVACDGGFGELKRHVKKAHNRFLCDLCTRHKKIFAHEHTLYTHTQYHKHCKSGDKSFNPNDDTGFKGHPECHFCRVNFYGDDELFEHCRDKHEQCHICVSRGIRHEYFADYNSMEKHFKKDHFLCEYRECLDKKFIVFGSDIDLKGHEMEEHGASIQHLPRSRQAEARRLDVGFDYGSSRNQERSSRNRTRGNDDSQAAATSLSSSNATAAASSSSSARSTGLTDSDFPGINGQPVQQQRSNSSTTSNSSSKRQQKSSTFRKPAGFGALSDNWPTLGQSSSNTSPAAAAPEVVSRHAAFMERVFDMLKSHDKLGRFRALTTAYRNSNIDVETYVNEIVDLCDANTETAGKIFKGVEDLMDNQEKKWEIVRSWRDKQTSMQNFPVLESSSPVPAGHGTSSRVLVIKSRNTRAGGTRSTGKSKSGVWDPPISFPTPNLNGPRTAWAGSGRTSGGSASAKENKKKDDFPSLGKSSGGSGSGGPQQHFPSLPTAPKRQHLVSLRRNGSNTQLNNAWGGERSFEPEPPADVPDDQPGKKKKGKKNKQVLLRVGL